MRIIEICPLHNGAHRNQTMSGIFPPDGWAVVPAGLDTTNFPFGEMTVEEIDGVATVTSWMPTEIPESEPASDPEPTEAERLRADVDFLLAMGGYVE